jgi:hypothetical protein
MQLTVYDALTAAIDQVPNDPEVWMEDGQVQLLVRLYLVQADGGRRPLHANRWWRVYQEAARAYREGGGYVGRQGLARYYHAGTLRDAVEGLCGT